MNAMVQSKRCGDLVIGHWHGGLCFEDGEAWLRGRCPMERRPSEARGRDRLAVSD